MPVTAGRCILNPMLARPLAAAAAAAGRRTLASTSVPRAPPALQAIEKCPPPSDPCACSAAPADLDIDRDSRLAGTMPDYYRHILISTGKEDWHSRIERDKEGCLAGRLKKIFKRRSGDFRDPLHQTLITNSSFHPAPPPFPLPLDPYTSAYIFPTGLYIPHIPLPPLHPSTLAPTAMSLIRGYLQPPSITTLPFLVSHHRSQFSARKIKETVVLICSHGTRDRRCGVMGPVLKEEFERVLGERGILVTREDEVMGRFEGRVRVGLTSHLSGHKFAGNVVVYFPGGEGEEGEEEEGVGIWYGRVSKREVEGIVGETVVGRRVVRELLRGVVGGGGKVVVSEETESEVEVDKSKTEPESKAI